MVNKLLDKIIDLVWLKIVAWVNRTVDAIRTRAKNKKAVDQVQSAETDEDLENAAKEIANRFD